MDTRPDVASILPFLPLILRSSSLFWPPKTLASLKSLSLGPDVSRVVSGDLLFDSILDLRETLNLPPTHLAPAAAEGYALFFDDLMDRVDARAWFGETVPMLTRLLMRLPGLLEEHYGRADGLLEGRGSGLRILGAQDAGIVFLSQELAAGLLTCSLFCLFPTSGRSANRLPYINFDRLFAGLLANGKQNQEEKIKCLIHYFGRVSSSSPLGSVSFERKVLSMNQDSSSILYPEAVYWEKSAFPLCPFKVSYTGLIEDQEFKSVEVDFANEYLGGGALRRGCVQEEIRFMINPELIVGMLFLPSMCNNEAIEIVGTERFSNYAGYGSSFRFTGDYDDKKPLDSLGRRETTIVAIDALYNQGLMQYGVNSLLRETNKAFCGFLNHHEYQGYIKTVQDGVPYINNLVQVRDDTCIKSDIFLLTEPAEHSQMDLVGDASQMDLVGNANHGSSRTTNCEFYRSNVGVSTGNWGCGAFGGDPEIKSIIQWLAASQASKAFILYYTFGNEALHRLKQVTEWILLHEWTVGDLWSILVEYSSLRLNSQTKLGFLNWLLPLTEDYSISDADDMLE